MIGQRGIPATFGGVERHVEELAAGLAARGHEVIVYNRYNYSRRTDSYRGVVLRRLPTIGTKHLDAIVHSFLATLAAVAARVDIIHYHALGPGIPSFLPRYVSSAKVVQTIHGLDSQRAKWGEFGRRVLRAAEWLSARVPDATIVVSRDLERHYAERYLCLTHCVPNGVSEPLPSDQDSVVENLGLVPYSYVLFVGRLVPEKAPDLLIQAFRDVPGEARLVLVGDSSYTDEYTSRLHVLGLEDPRVVFTGYVYGSLLSELYSKSAAFVLPSDLEGMPLTLLEAAARGAPLVASDIPPHVEIIGPSHAGGRLFPSGDREALAALLRQVLANQHEEREGAEQFKRRVLDEYSWGAAVERTEGIYRSLLAKGLT